MKSYIILGIYSLLTAFFWAWDASLFVLMASLFVEMILIFIGTVLVGRNARQKTTDVGKSGAFYALFVCMFFIYPMAYMMGDTYDEFSKPNIHGLIQPVYDYKWEILVMAVLLGLGYLSDFKSLKKTNLADFISNEVYRVTFVIFGLGLLGMMCIEGIDEMTEIPPTFLENGKQIFPFPKDTKWIPITVMISGRVGIEIWYLLFSSKKEEV